MNRRIDAARAPEKPACAQRPHWLPTVPEVLVGLGLGCYLAWVDCTFHGSQIVNIDPTAFPELPLNRSVYLISIVVLCAALLACAVFHRTVDRFLYRPAMLYAMPAAMCASTLAMLGIPAGGAAGWAFVAVAGVCTALSSAACLLHWGALSSAMNMHEIVETAVVGFLSSQVLSTLFQLVAAAPLADPRAVGALLIGLDALFPLVSGAALVWFARREDIAVAPAALPSDTGAGGDGDGFPIIARLCAALVLVGFVMSTCRDLSFAIGGQDGYRGGAPDVFAGIAAVLAVGCTFVCRAFFSDDAHRRVGSCYRTLVLCAVVGACSVPAPLVFDNARLSITSALSIGTLSCCNVLMWITTAGICRRWRSRVTSYFAAMRLCWALGPLLGIAFCGTFVRDGAGLPVLYIHAVVSTVALFVAYAFFFTEATLGEALSLIPRKYRRPFKERCAEAARLYGLTDRELEVMTLFAKGRDSAFIQKELSLSKSTVSTHRQHIYGKLGVHSQQELLNRLFELENDA